MTSTAEPGRAARDRATAKLRSEAGGRLVTHAGLGGCGEGLRAGVPMIAAPQGAEQFMNADRLVEPGVARRIDTAEATAETLRAALNDLVTGAEVARRSAWLRADAGRGPHGARRRPHRGHAHGAGSVTGAAGAR